MIRNFFIKLLGGLTIEDRKRIEEESEKKNSEISLLKFDVLHAKSEVLYAKDHIRTLKKVIGMLKFNSEKTELYDTIEELDHKLEEFETFKEKNSEYVFKTENDDSYIVYVDKPLTIYGDCDMDIKITRYRNHVPKETLSAQSYKVEKDILGNKK